MIEDIDVGWIDLPKFMLEQAARERELLALARRQPTARRPKHMSDEAAAQDLLLWFSHAGKMTDPAVHEALLDGMRQVAAHVVNSSILQKDGEAPHVHALMFFNGVDAPGKRGVKNKIGKRLALVAAHADAERGSPLLTLGDLRGALTTRLGQPLPRHEWPRSIRRAEARLVAYVERKHKGATPEECRWYIHASFDLRWGDQGDFPYPDEWN